MTTYNVVDIEKPSSVSSQYVYLLKYTLKPEDRIKNGETIVINVNIEYNLHFRYRTPDYHLEYKQSFVNAHPEFYFDCLNNELHMNKTTKEFGDSFVYSTVSKVLSKVQVNSDENREKIVVLIPTGNMNQLPIVLIFTLFLTLTAALFIGKKTLDKRI